MARVSRQLALSVALRARSRCEYCHLHEDHTHLEFQPDHIIATKHRGVTTLENLAWACFWCNCYKGACVGGPDPRTGRFTRLFNPRDDVWLEHFRREGGLILGRTAIGRSTIAVLNMNETSSVAVRLEILAAFDADDR